MKPRAICDSSDSEFATNGNVKHGFDIDSARCHILCFIIISVKTLHS
jgi:hypothetical protein